MDSEDLNQLLYGEQKALLLARTASTQARRLRHHEIARAFGRRIAALHYPYRSTTGTRWAPYDPAPRGTA